MNGMYYDWLVKVKEAFKKEPKVVEVGRSTIILHGQDGTDYKSYTLEGFATDNSFGLYVCTGREKAQLQIERMSKIGLYWLIDGSALNANEVKSITIKDEPFTVTI